MLSVTRFTNETYLENNMYRSESNVVVLYGSPIKISATYPVDSFLYVIEMNNDLNRIEGIGLIKNRLVCDERHRIYSTPEYNRYIYKGDKWISRGDIENIDSSILDICDLVLFKGKSHLKRRTGITVITSKVFNHWKERYAYTLIMLQEKIAALFAMYFDNK